MSVAPGWFLDPAGRPDTYRWWDGQGWTRWLGGDPRAGRPQFNESPETTTPQAPVPTRVATPAAKPPGDPAGGPAGSAVGPAAAGGRIRVPLAVALVAGVLVLAVLVVGFTVVLTEDRIRTGPALAPPSAIEDTGLLYDSRTRELRVQTVQLVMPAEPYLCATTPDSYTRSFSSSLLCNAEVHADYDGRSDWAATVGLGLVVDELVADDPAQTARNLYAALQRQFFSRTQTTVRKLTPVRAAGIPADKAFFLTGEVHYRIKGLTSRYDRLVVGVLPLPSGQQAAFFSSRPDDTPEATLEVLNRSIASLRAG